jgi:hypothetical protein
MAGDLARLMKESAGMPVGAALPANDAAMIRAMRPQDSLQPLAELFSKAGDRRQFLHSLSDYVRRLLGASAVILHEKGEDGRIQFIGISVTPNEPGDGGRWIPQSEEIEKVIAARASQQANVFVDGRQHARLVVPFFESGRAPVCLTAYLPPERIAFLDPCFSMLHLTTQFIVQRDLLSASHEKEEAFHQATMLVAMFSRTADADTFKRSLFGLSTELEKFFGCQRVAIGTGSKHACVVHAVSGMSGVEQRTLGFSQLGAAMRESIALSETIVWPGQEDLINEVVVSANHDDLLHSFKSGRVVVVPLRHEASGFSGALALLWPAGSPAVNRRTYHLICACQPHLAALVCFLQRSKPGAFRAGVLKFWRGGAAKRALALTGIALFLGAMVFPVTYRIPADGVIQPVMRRTVAAPFESRLQRSHVKPGDEVSEGQIIAELDGREIRVALAESIAAQSSALKKRDDAMVSADASSLQMAQLEADRLALEVERLQFRNDNLLIRSPVKGVVLTGDLKRSEGVPVNPGQKLFEIAPLEEMLIEVSIPERAIGLVTPTMPVALRLEYDSGKIWRTELRKVHPVSEIVDGRNVFIGEALLVNENGELRPGMKGSVRIESRKKPLGWIFFHGLWDFLRLKLW